MAQGIKLAIVGATGAVGQEMMRILWERKFPVSELICMADAKEAGQKLKYGNQEVIVKAAREAEFANADIALFAVNTEISQQLAPAANRHNCVVIDNSYAYRLDKQVPLVVPEVNPDDIARHKGIISNPNCSTIILAVAINPIHKAAGLERVIVSTYQAVSGAGIAGLNELKKQVEAVCNNEEVKTEVFQHQIAFNLIPHIDSFVEEQYTREEMKLVWETRKIMHAPELKIAATAVRVPVYRSHSESVNLQTKKPLSAEAARKILSQAPGVIVQDDPDNNIYPMPLYTSMKDEVYVGRIRKDISCDQGIVFWIAADQIRKGAATNAIQIAEIVVKENLY